MEQQQQVTGKFIVRRSEDEILKHLEEQDRSGFAVKEYCETYDIVKRTFYSWIKKYRGKPEDDVTGFATIEVTPTMVHSKPKLLTEIGNIKLYKKEKQLGLFLNDGMLLMDTSLIENAIRPITLGRNNCFFAGSHEAAQNAAIIYSLFATCKLHEINAFEWLKFVLTAMPTHPYSRIKGLLPQNWNQLVTKP